MPLSVEEKQDAMERVVFRNYRKFGSTTRSIKDLKRIGDHFNDERFELDELKGELPKKEAIASERKVADAFVELKNMVSSINDRLIQVETAPK